MYCLYACKSTCDHPALSRAKATASKSTFEPSLTSPAQTEVTHRWSVVPIVIKEKEDILLAATTFALASRVGRLLLLWRWQLGRWGSLKGHESASVDTVCHWAFEWSWSINRNCTLGCAWTGFLLVNLCVLLVSPIVYLVLPDIKWLYIGGECPH